MTVQRSINACVCMSLCSSRWVTRVSCSWHVGHTDTLSELHQTVRLLVLTCRSSQCRVCANTSQNTHARAQILLLKYHTAPQQTCQALTSIYTLHRSHPFNNNTLSPQQLLIITVIQMILHYNKNCSDYMYLDGENVFGVFSQQPHSPKHF